MRRGFASGDAASSAAASAFRQLSRAGRRPIGWVVERVKPDAGTGWFARIGCDGGPVEVWPVADDA